MTPTKEWLEKEISGLEATLEGCRLGGYILAQEAYGMQLAAYRLALSALEPKGQALPEMWSEDILQGLKAFIEGRQTTCPIGVTAHIRALQRHILSARAVEWRKVREIAASMKDKLYQVAHGETVCNLGTWAGHDSCDALARRANDDLDELLSLLPAEEGEPDAKV